MYVYLYDNFVRQGKYASVLKAIEIRLTDLGLSGKVLAVTTFNDIRAVIQSEIKRGAKTIVVVGDDVSFGQILSHAADIPCTFGFLPIGRETAIADILGIPVGPEAATVLSRRRREQLDVAEVNNRYFVGQLRVPPARVQVVYDDRFKITAGDLMEIIVCNAKPFTPQKKMTGSLHSVNPQDGRLEAYLQPLTKKPWWGYTTEEASIFPFLEMKIVGKSPFTVEVDGRVSKETKLTIHIAPCKVDVIVGKERKF
jgi:hypothetical protein